MSGSERRGQPSGESGPLRGSPPGQAVRRGWRSLKRWVRTTWVQGESPTPPGSLVAERAEGAAAAIVFVHGFGSTGTPFGRFPEALQSEPALENWDIYTLGYTTSLMPDLRGFWESDPSLELLATYLHTRMNVEPLEDYAGIAIVAHSMGGLVAQQALLDDPRIADRVSHLFMFGTPSNGVRIARWGSFLKQQIEDMVEGGPFISGLRKRWDERYGRHRPFDLWVIAGDRDRFVPASSSLRPFPPESQLVVPGDHLELVDVDLPDSLSAQVVVDGLVGEAAPAGPLNAARIAVESSEHDRVIRELGDEPAELDEQHLVDLALAYEATGQRETAIELLTDHAGKHGTDATGTLAGRFKRRWLDEGHKSDADSALELYSDALERARAAEDDEQVYYLAINVAFMRRAYGRDHEAAAEAASAALDACASSPKSYWRLATKAEAQLHLDQPEQALETYRTAVALDPPPRELISTYLQARQLAEVMGRRDLYPALETAFGRPGTRSRPEPRENSR